MLSTTKTISINGTSTVEVNGVKTPVAYFNAQIQSDGKYNINQSIQNVDAYKSNKDVVKADYDEFEAFFYLLNPTEYKLKSDKDGIVRVGFGAQTVKAAMDAAGIAENEFHGFSHEYVDMSQFETEEERQQFLERNFGNADTYSLSYQEFIALNTHMIQKQHQEIEQLKSDNFALKGELDILKQRLKIMEEKLC